MQPHCFSVVVPDDTAGAKVPGLGEQVRPPAANRQSLFELQAHACTSVLQRDPSGLPAQSASDWHPEGAPPVPELEAEDEDELAVDVLDVA